MRMLEALSHRNIRRLWGGQLFSAVGDEVYGIALVWSATELMGERAGYLSAIQAGSIFLFSLLGGLIADHRDHRHVMIASDLARGALVLVIPLSTLVSPLSLWVLVPVAIGVSSLSAFFDPALKSFLPQLIDDREILPTSYGLMEMTSRIARVIGPSFVGAMSRIVPAVHYFTVDAFSFFASAWAVRGLRREHSAGESVAPRLGIKQSLLAGQKLVFTNRTLTFVIFSGALSGAAWLFVFPLGITLLVRERLSENVGSLGYAIAGYGVGNVVSNLILANIACRRPVLWLYAGRFFAGIGFALLAVSPSLATIMGSCAVAAVGGPLTDLGFVNMVQRTFHGRELARVFRYSMAVSYGCLLVTFLVSPSLLERFSTGGVIFVAALVIFLTGAGGFLFPLAIARDD